MYFGKIFDFRRKNVKWSAILGDHFCSDFVRIGKVSVSLIILGQSMLRLQLDPIGSNLMQSDYMKALRVIRAITIGWQFTARLKFRASHYRIQRNLAWTSLNTLSMGGLHRCFNAIGLGGTNDPSKVCMLSRKCDFRPKIAIFVDN